MQDQIDGEKFIHQNPTGGLKRDVDKCKLENHEVYGMDVVMTTGKGIVSAILQLISISY